MKLFPSIASSNLLYIGDTLKKLESWPYLHIDIEDGNFIPNITFGLKTIRAICSELKDKYVHVHLMVTNPMDYLEELAKCNVNAVVTHIEALEYPMQFLNKCKSLGMETGLSLNIKTAPEETKVFWPLMDQMLFMTSEPDNAGENLYEPALERVIDFASNMQEKLDIYVDGGLTKDSLYLLNKSGVNGAVLGRLVFQNEDPLKALENIKSGIDCKGD
ncbi:MAG: ribulose-phosphate 3-epimerase [Acetivibrionales bacterium]|jgi:ribulose-phosphate 3-epimerase